MLQDKKIRGLHFKAYQYYIRMGENHLAIEQAILADQPVTAAKLLERVNINELIEVQIARKIIDYRNLLPIELTSSNSKLAKLYAFSCIMTLRPEDAKDCLAEFDKLLPPSSSVEQQDLTTYWLGLQGVAQHLSGASQAAYNSCSQLLENFSQENWLVALMSWAVLIQHRLFRVELNLAEGLINKALSFPAPRLSIVALLWHSTARCMPSALIILGKWNWHEPTSPRYLERYPWSLGGSK
jgi:ATP/maltotriose-dependent transcriptional regulator MalT